MRKHTCVLAFFILGIAATAVRATPIDPRIIVSGAGDATAVTTPVFTFMSDPSGGGVLSFINDTRSDWFSLDFFVALPQGSPIACSSPLYSLCEFTSTNIPGTTQATFDIGFDNPVGKGLLPGETFTINLDNTGSVVDGSGNWGADNTFTAAVNLPEPASWLLLASGMALLAGLCRYRRRVQF